MDGPICLRQGPYNSNSRGPWRGPECPPRSQEAPADTALTSQVSAVGLRNTCLFLYIYSLNPNILTALPHLDQRLCSASSISSVKMKHTLKTVWWFSTVPNQRHHFLLKLLDRLLPYSACKKKEKSFFLTHQWSCSTHCSQWPWMGGGANN